MRSSKIQLDEDYRVESDSVCWTLIFDKITGVNEKTGKEKRRYETWYYPSLEVALRAYRDLHVRGSKSIDDVMKRIAESDAVIRQILESVTKVKPLVDPDDMVLDKTKPGRAHAGRSVDSSVHRDQPSV